MSSLKAVTSENSYIKLVRPSPDSNTTMLNPKSMPWTDERTLPRLKRDASRKHLSASGGVSSLQRTDSNFHRTSSSSCASSLSIQNPAAGSMKRNFHPSISPSINSHSQPLLPRRTGSLPLRCAIRADQKDDDQTGTLLRRTDSTPNPSQCHTAATDEIEPADHAADRELDSLARLFELGQQSGHIKVVHDSDSSSLKKSINTGKSPSHSIVLTDSSNSSVMGNSMQRTPSDSSAPLLHKSRPLIPLPRRAGSLPVRCTTGVHQKDDNNPGPLPRRAGSLPNPRRTVDSIESAEAEISSSVQSETQIEPEQSTHTTNQGPASNQESNLSIMSSSAHSKLGSGRIRFALAFRDFGTTIFRAMARRTTISTPLLEDGEIQSRDGVRAQRTDVISIKLRTTSLRDVMKIRQRGHQSRQIGVR